MSSAMQLLAFVPIGAIRSMFCFFPPCSRWLHTGVATWFVICMRAGVALDEERLVCFPESLQSRTPMTSDEFSVFPVLERSGVNGRSS